jgi:hypothetical protein
MIGQLSKLERFLQLQEFSLRNPTTSSITVARRSPHSSNPEYSRPGCNIPEVGNILAKAAALRINLNIDGAYSF